MGRLWYLATPYSRYPEGHEAAFVMACLNASVLMKEGVLTFSPIAHSHPIAVHGDMDKVDPKLWEDLDAPFVARCDGMIYLEAAGHENSRGMQHELREFVKAGKPVVFMRPGVVPEALMRPIFEEAERHLTRLRVTRAETHPGVIRARQRVGELVARWPL